MTLEIQTTPISGATALEAGGDRGVTLDPSLLPAFTAHGRAEEKLDRLVHGNALCVTSGQQPGLFTGPLYTVYKAVSAVVVARACEVELGRPVVPVYWVAGDDHDYAEANRFALLSTANEIEELGLPPRAAGAPSTPLYREKLGPEIEDLIARLTELVPETEFRADAVAWLRRHYRVGHTMAAAFAGAMAELLGPAGLVVFDPTHPAAKAASAPYLLDALARASELDEQLRGRAEELERAGAPVPVTIHEGNTLVMVDGSAGRDRLTLAGERFVTRRSGETWTFGELETLLAESPERLSANVLLRPAVEAAILPTVAYVAGPGELAYIPQATPIYETLGVTPQPFVPRWSARIIETRVRKTLDKYDLTPEDFEAPEGQLEARLVHGDMPSGASDALDRLRKTVDQEFSTLIDAAKQIDPTLEKPVQHTRNQIVSGFEHVEKRLVSGLKRRNDVLLRQLATVRNAILPNGQPQERVYNVFQYLVKYGPRFLQEAEASCAAWVESREPVTGREPADR